MPPFQAVSIAHRDGRQDPRPSSPVRCSPTGSRGGASSLLTGRLRGFVWLRPWERLKQKEETRRKVIAIWRPRHRETGRSQSSRLGRGGLRGPQRGGSPRTRSTEVALTSSLPHTQKSLAHPGSGSELHLYQPDCPHVSSNHFSSQGLVFQFLVGELSPKLNRGRRRGVHSGTVSLPPGRGCRGTVHLSGELGSPTCGPAPSHRPRVTAVAWQDSAEARARAKAALRRLGRTASRSPALPWQTRRPQEAGVWPSDESTHSSH